MSPPKIAAPTDSFLAANVRRTLIYTATGHDAVRLVEAELKRLESEHQRIRKRKLPPEILSLSSWGQKPNVSLGLTAYTTPLQSAELEFLAANVSDSPPAAMSAYARAA